MVIAEQVDLSAISYFLPLFSFLLVFIIVYAVLVKSKIIANNGLQLFTAFLMATIFVSATGAKDYVLHITSWVALLLASLFFIMLILGLVGKEVEFLHKGIGIAFVVITILLFIISAVVVFSDYFSSYLPWNNGIGANQDILQVTDWFFSSRIFGAFILLVISGLVSWVLMNSTDKKK